MEILYANPEIIRMGNINVRRGRGYDNDGLCNDIRCNGILNPLMVRELKGINKNKHHMFEIVDGSRRLQCALSLRLEEVPIIITILEDW